MIIKLKIKLITVIIINLIFGLGYFQPQFVNGQTKQQIAPDTMPNEIRVLLDKYEVCVARNEHRDDNNQLICVTDQEVKGGATYKLDPDTYTMDEYVLGVLKAEVGPVSEIPTWHIEALKANAVAARSVGWFNAVHYEGDSYQVSSNMQAFFPEKPTIGVERYEQAVTATTGQFLSHSEGHGAAEVINAQYKTQNGHPTNPCSLGVGQDCPTAPDACDGLALPYFTETYLKGVPDPISANETRSQIDCNSVGMGQYGSQRLAIGNADLLSTTNDPTYPPLTYRQILSHYYPEVALKDALNNNAVLIPQYRWLPIQVFWHTPNNQPPLIDSSQTYTATIISQNSGTTTWQNANQILISYHGWNQTPVARLLMPNTPTNYPIEPGNIVTTTLFLNPPTPPYPGTGYTLAIEMFLLDQNNDYLGFSEVELNRLWPTYKVTVCVDALCPTYMSLVVVNTTVH